jgi:hypothetical protein
MSELSEHTKLMNYILYLASKNRFCKPVLYDNHYILESIEVKFNKQNGDSIHADVSLKNPEKHNLLFIECKDGSLVDDQAERYHTLNRDDIVNAGITTLSGAFNHEVAYVTTVEKKDKLIFGIKNKSYNFPIIASDEKKMRLEYNSFSCPVLQKLFSEKGGVDLPVPPPVFYYPFGSNDSDAFILASIAPVLIRFRGQEFDVEELLKEKHQLYDYIGDASLKELKRRVGTLLSALSSGDLNEFFDLPSKKDFKLKEFGFKKFQTALEHCVSNADKKVPIDKQKSLSEF